MGVFRILAVTLLAAVAAADASKPSVILQVDHVSVCASDLPSLQQAFTDAGLKPDYGGPHANGVTHMALLGFDDGSYLELIAPQKPGMVEGSSWAKAMTGNAGACAWAVDTHDLKQEVGRLKAVGIAVGTPQPGSRKRPDGLSIEWTTATLGDGPQGSVLPFIIEDTTPRAWRVQPTASLKTTGLTGIDTVVIAVNNLESSISLFQRAYGWTAPLVESHSEFGARMAYFPGMPVILASPLDKNSWLTERLEKFGEGPAVFMLATRNVTAVTKRLHLAAGKSWFGQKVAWFDATKLQGARLGVVGP